MAEKKTYEELEEHIRKPENQLHEQQSAYNPDMPIRKTLNISDISFENLFRTDNFLSKTLDIVYSI